MVSSTSAHGKNEQKIVKVDSQFEKAGQIYKNPKKIEELKKNSSLKKFCLAVRAYMLGHHKDACTEIYHLMKVRPWRTNDMTIVQHIKTKLQELRNKPQEAPPSPPKQLDLFATP